MILAEKEWMCDEWMEMCEWLGGWLVKQNMQLQNKSFPSQYMSWLLKGKRLKQSFLTKWLILILHQQPNTMYVTEIHLSRRTSQKMAIMYTLTSDNVFEATIKSLKNELTQLRTSKNDRLTGWVRPLITHTHTHTHTHTRARARTRKSIQSPNIWLHHRLNIFCDI